ncbi:MAG: hypothetical protein CBC29_06675 [Methylococcaceae bacterium TMED69]|nr:MAG: hypothetical protein CBC29_06675 [Methylococcaceae bacterium TMED69]|tara:strand:- start:4304 stop:4561 length:258 start_codon:yes stop_codon:yes gene_type:complete
MQATTPLEKYLVLSKNQVEISNILIATTSVVDVIKECEKQIEDYREKNDPDSEEIKKNAALDLLLAEATIIMMAEKLETEFGICA